MSRLKNQVTITLSAIQVSDLFFNAENKEYDALYESTHKGNEPKRVINDPTDSEIRGALIEDAKTFLASFPGMEFTHSAEALADDFLERV